MTCVLRATLCAFAFLELVDGGTLAQCSDRQQRIAVELHVRMDVKDHLYEGRMVLRYFNNSPDTLPYLYFHLYPNAFKPGSEMDIRSRSVPDPDKRIGDRIAGLAPGEQGALTCSSVEQGGAVLSTSEDGTLMKCDLVEPVLPGGNTTLELTFQGQVPVQIRRSGRDNAEGVDLSMTQWYPKVAAYDQRGWHTDPYVAREFYGEWGDYELYITIDASYTVAATGVLQNQGEIGHGYAESSAADDRSELTWHFKADQVHDVAWAADPDYVHTTAQVPGGPLLRFFHIPDEEFEDAWARLPEYMVRSFQFMNERFGAYPWPEYAFVQGGDGGMEYPMLTLITGKRRLGSLVGVSVHESVHSWFYGMLASNEAQYPWMDEGGTEFAGSRVMQHLFDGEGDPHAPSMDAYFALVGQPDDEPMGVHADHFMTNRAYYATAYSKGELLLSQLRSVMGDSALLNGMRRYIRACRFKHPGPVDLELALEKSSGMVLDWYFDQWLHTTRMLDMAVDSMVAEGGATRVHLSRNGGFLMPATLTIRHSNGVTRTLGIPLTLMRSPRSEGIDEVLPPWSWTDRTYSFLLPMPINEVEVVQIDRENWTMDLDRSNDRYPRKEED